MMRKTFAKIVKFPKKRKFVFGIIVIAVVFGVYFGVKTLIGNKNEIRYVLATAEKGTLIVSVSGTGQVSASNQTDIKSKVNGEIMTLYAVLGKEVNTGTVLAQIDTQDAERAVRDAQTAFETAELELEELQKPVDELTLLQAENSLAQAKNSKQKAQDDLKKAYEDGFNTVADAFLDIPAVMAGLNGILFGHNFSNNQENISYYANAVQAFDDRVLRYKDDTYNAYQKARAEYDQNFNDYKSASRFSEASSIESLIDETYETTKSIAEAVKSANNLIQFYEDKLTERELKPNSLATTHLSSLNSYTGITNSNVSSLLSAQRAIKDSVQAIADAEVSIQEKSLSLAKIKEGADELTIRAKKIAIQQKEDALLTAKETLADCYVRAPFSGVIVKVNVKKGDSISSGTALFTLATKQKIAEISLNEVDVAKVKVGQKATLVFDAIDGLNISGEVAEIDSLGTVSQGVVTYNVKIVFDAQDDRVKPGMSVSASIITQAKPDVLVVSNSAIKTNGNESYVEILTSATTSQSVMANSTGKNSQNLPRQQLIEVGLSNDTMTEVLSGLQEGDQVVTQTITANASKQNSQSQQNSSLRMPGVGGGFVGR